MKKFALLQHVPEMRNWFIQLRCQLLRLAKAKYRYVTADTHPEPEHNARGKFQKCLVSYWLAMSAEQITQDLILPYMQGDFLEEKL